MKTIKAKEALDMIKRIRKIVSRLPEVAEATDKFGHVSFRVDDKPFVMIGEGEGQGSAAIKCDLETQHFLIEKRGYRRTPYIGRHGWASLAQLPPEDWTEVEQLVVEGFCLVAPTRLAKQVRNDES